MRLPEELQQLLVSDSLGVIHDTHGLGVAGHAAADFLVGGIGGRASLVADGGDDHARLLPEVLLLAPETAERELGDLRAFWIRNLQRLVVEEVALRGGDRLWPAGERVGR